MLPLLISVLTIPNSLDMAILPGLSGMVVIAALVLAKFSPEHAAALVFAEAGVKARAENTAARTSLRKKHQRSAGYRIRAGRPIRFEKVVFLCAAMQREGLFRRAGIL